LPAKPRRISFTKPRKRAAPMRVQIILAGVGGQGVLFATRVFSQMAMAKGFPVIGSETHGMSQRGGSVVSHLKLGQFNSPLIGRGTADIVYAFEKNESYRSLHFLRGATGKGQGGLCFINAPDEGFMEAQISTYLRERGAGVYVLAADAIARELGSPLSSNLVLIGFSSAHPSFPFQYDDLKETVRTVSPSRFREANLVVLERGYQEGKRRKW
jgi:indolepyruvate ferredoxin oxidoreductase beta subunit